MSFSFLYLILFCATIVLLLPSFFFFCLIRSKLLSSFDTHVFLIF